MLKKLSFLSAIVMCPLTASSTDPIIVTSNMTASIQMTSISGSASFTADGEILGYGFSNNNSTYTSVGRVLLTALDGTKSYLIQYDPSTTLSSSGNCCNITMNNIYFDVLGVQNNNTVTLYDGQSLSLL